jgi:hypothetical protein
MEQMFFYCLKDFKKYLKQFLNDIFMGNFLTMSLHGSIMEHLFWS